MSKKFDDSLFEDKPFESEEMDDNLFEDTKFESKESTPMAQQEPESPSMLESAIGGAEQGATFGFSDEMAGGVQSGLDTAQRLLNEYTGLVGKSPSQVDEELQAQGMTGDINPNIYEAARDEERARLEELSEANPGSFLAGELGGGIILPGGASAKALSKLDKVKDTIGIFNKLKKISPTVLGNTIKASPYATVGAIDAGLYGAGQNVEEGELLGDTATSALGGAVMGPLAAAAATAGGKAAKGIKNYIDDFDSMRNLKDSYKFARSGDNIAGQSNLERNTNELLDTAEGTVENLGEHIGGLAKTKRQAIEGSDQTIPLEDLLTPIKEGKSGIKEILEGESDIKKIDKLLKQMPENFDENVPLTEAEQMMKMFRDLSGQSSPSQIPRLRTEQAQEIFGDAQSAARKLLNESDEAVSSANKDIFDIRNAAESLGLDKIASGQGNRADIARAQNKMANMIKNQTSENPVPGLDKRRLEKLKEVAESQGNIDLVNKIDSMMDKSRKYELSRSASLRANLSSIVDAAPILTGDAGGRLVRGLDNITKIPSATSKLVNTTKNLSDKLINMNSYDMAPMIKQLAGRGKAGQRLAETLVKIGEKPPGRTRNALLFSLMQHPEYRNLLTPHLNDNLSDLMQDDETETTTTEEEF